MSTAIGAATITQLIHSNAILKIFSIRFHNLKCISIDIGDILFEKATPGCTDGSYIAIQAATKIYGLAAAAIGSSANWLDRWLDSYNRYSYSSYIAY